MLIQNYTLLAVKTCSQSRGTGFPILVQVCYHLFKYKRSFWSVQLSRNIPWNTLPGMLQVTGMKGGVRLQPDGGQVGRKREREMETQRCNLFNSKYDRLLKLKNNNEIAHKSAGRIFNTVQIITTTVLYNTDWLWSWINGWQDVTITICMRGLPWQNDSCHGSKAHYGLLLK